jgi:YD repeat-containing protein
MPDIGKAILAGTKGVATGIGLMQAEERTELMQERLAFDKQLSDLNLQLKNKQNQLLQQRNLIDVNKMGFEFIKMATPVDGWTTKQKEAIVESSKKQFGVDFEPLFKPKHDEKTGNIISYNIESEKSYKDKLDAEAKKIDQDINKVKAAASKIEAEAALKAANPKTAISWFVNHKKNLKPKEVIDFVNEISTAEATGMELEWNYDQFGNLTGVKTAGMKITKPVTSKGFGLELEKKLMSSVDELAAITDVELSEFTDILTIPGKIENKLLVLRDKLTKKELPLEEQERIGKAYEYISNLGMFFDTYRMKITKAQAAIKELEMLRSRVVHEKMSKSQAKYMTTVIKNRIGRQIRLQRLVARKGLSGDAFWSEFNSVLSNAIRTKTDPSLTKEQISIRHEELKKIYINSNRDPNGIKPFVVDQLRKEGYIP